MLSGRRKKYGYQSDDDDDENEEDLEEDSDTDEEESSVLISDIIDTKVRNLLEKANRKHHISEKRVEFLSEKFQDLHLTFKEVEQRESMLLAQNQNLYKELKALEEKDRNRNAERLSLRKKVEELHNERKKAHNQLCLLEENIKNNNSVLQEKTTSLRSLEKKVKKKREEREKKAKPMIEELHRQIVNSSNKLNELKQEHDANIERKQQLIEKIKFMNEELENKVNSVINNRDRFDKISFNPIQEKKQVELVIEAHGNLKKRIHNQNNSIYDYEESIKDLSAIKSRYEDSNKHLLLNLENEVKSKLTLDQQIESISISVKKEKELHSKLTTNLMKSRNELKNLKEERKILSEKIRAEKRSLDNSSREIEKKEKKIDVGYKLVVGLSNKKEDLDGSEQKFLKNLNEYKKRIKESGDTLTIGIHKYMKKDEKINSLEEEVGNKEKELKKEDEEVLKLISIEKELLEHEEKLKSKREELSRSASESKKKFVNTMGKLKILNFNLLELNKKIKSVKKEYTKLTKKYEELKLSRNKYTKLITQNSQNFGSLKENKKIVDNEYDVLSRKSFQSQNVLLQVRKEHTFLLDGQEKLKQKYGILLNISSKLKSSIVMTKSKILKSESLIDSKQNLLNSLLKKLNDLTMNRNKEGVNLIDLNDLITLLYTKSSIQKNVLKDGIVQYKKLLKTKQILKNTLDQVTMELKTSIFRVCKLNTLQREKTILESDLKTTDQLLNKLTKKIIDPKQRNIKIEKPKKKISKLYLKELLVFLKKKDQMVTNRINERKMLLNEAKAENKKLKKIFKKKEEQDLAMELIEMNRKLKEKNTTIKTLLTEITLYETQIINEESKQEAILKLMKDNKKLRKQWDEEFENEKKLEERRYEMKKKMEMEKEKEKMENVKLPRPNCYIPDVGNFTLPRPYLMKPVLPQIVGVNQRFYKKPKNKNIEI